MAGIVRHRQTKEPDTDRPSLNHRATSRLYRSVPASRRYAPALGACDLAHLCFQLGGHTTAILIFWASRQTPSRSGSDLALIQNRGAPVNRGTDPQQSVVTELGEIPQAFSKMLKGHCSNHR
jgi:hypothetical protein